MDELFHFIARFTIQSLLKCQNSFDLSYKFKIRYSISDNGNRKEEESNRGG